MKVIGKLEDLKTIKHISFDILSKEDILNISVCEILNTKKIGSNSVYDIKMGPQDNSSCITCNLTALECPGHFGHITLVYPIIHPFFYTRIENIIKCFCWSCHAPLFDKNMFQSFKGENKFQKIYEKIKKSNKICGICDYENKNFKIIDGFLFENETKISFQDFFDFIENISNNFLNEIVDIKKFLIEILPVIPTVCRPQLKTEDIVCDDDLTIQYIEIIKNNNYLKEEKLSDEKKNKYYSVLNFRISTLFNNSSQKAKHTTNAKPIKSILERLSGKEGQIRNNALGKRTELSSRTVISPDPTLKLNEVRIPQEIAKILTFPELVTSYNFQKLNKIVNIENKAKYIKKKNGIEIDVQRYINIKGTQLYNGDIITELNGNEKIYETFENFDVKKKNQITKILRNEKEISFVHPHRRNFELTIGDTVFRELINNDWIIINRCPSLHKNSFQGMKIIISPQKTISFNLAICKSMNADFDGDEINGWAPYDYRSVAEIQEIINAEKNIIAVSSGKNIIAISQDSLVASYLMTKQNEKIEKKYFFDLISEIPNIDYLKEIQRIRKLLKKENKKAQCFNGKGLISMILPNDFFYELESLKIKEGVIIDGFLDYKTLGTSTKSIIYVLNKDYSSVIASNFIDCIHFLTNKWLMFEGLTISLKDCIPHQNNLKTEINKIIENSCSEIQFLEEIITNENIKEVKTNFIVNKIKDECLKLTKNFLHPNNNFLQIINSGSKGNIINVTQISGLVGQQNIEVGRIPLQLNHKKRSLIFFPINEKKAFDQISEKGFVSSSYVNGLKPHEMYFAAIAGREAICQTAMGTSVSGYSQRRIGKLMENLVVAYDDTVRNRNNKIISFNYNDGVDCAKSNDINVDGIIQRLNFQYEKNIKN